MAVAKIAITIEQESLVRVDQLVTQARYPNRSRAIQSLVDESLSRLEVNRLARECALLDPRVEQALADTGLHLELETWPQY
jgi:Arc/MetJ-type ribon-helix-helix transcriptional regulator